MATANYNFSGNLPRTSRLTDPTQCTLYFISGAGLIKIGITTNLTSRLRAIRNSSPVPVQLIGKMPGCTALEGIIHSRFSGLRKHGEWFADDGQIRRFLQGKVDAGQAEFCE